MSARNKTLTGKRVALTSLLLGVIVVTGYTFFPATTRYAQAGYAFEVDDRAQVSGYSDHVVLAQVSEDGTTPEDEPPRTTYSLRVERSLKGSLSEESSIGVVQHGVDVTGKRRQLLTGVEPLVTGRTYVIALTQDDEGTLTLVSGPHSPEAVESAGDRFPGSGVVATWEDAIEDERWPEALS